MLKEQAIANAETVLGGVPDWSVKTEVETEGTDTLVIFRGKNHGDVGFFEVRVEQSVLFSEDRTVPGKVRVLIAGLDGDVYRPQDAQEIGENIADAVADLKAHDASFRTIGEVAEEARKLGREPAEYMNEVMQSAHVRR
ncbi:hypothetical protein [Agromyces sp. NPDC057865]|uniref:hypothetical protein n=1 Tax=Agromyces sp. NPDC057865 TaxID=3346267 RepID=UPI0036711599